MTALNGSPAFTCREELPACVLRHYSPVQLFVTLWTVARQAPLYKRLFRQEYCSGLPFLPLGIFPTQGSNLSLLQLLYCRWILYHLAIGETCHEDLLVGNKKFNGPYHAGTGTLSALVYSHIFYKCSFQYIHKNSQPYIQLSSVTQSSLTFCDLMDFSTPGFPVHHQLFELVMPSNYLIFCHSLLYLPSIFPSIRVFSNESVLPIRWRKYWNFIFSISPSNECSGLISLRTDWLDLLGVQGTLKSLLQSNSSKASILQLFAFFVVQLSHSYLTTGKTIALTWQTFVGKVMFLFLTCCLSWS